VNVIQWQTVLDL